MNLRSYPQPEIYTHGAGGMGSSSETSVSKGTIFCQARSEIA